MNKPNEGAAEDKLPAVRRQQLIDWFDANLAGMTLDLAKQFGTSVSTIRRDLDMLAQEGFLKRTHGGAVRTREHTAYEPSTDLASRTAVEEKLAIVEEARKRIKPGQSIIVDTGAIAQNLADVISELEFHLTLVTNDLYAAQKFTYKPHFKVIVPGGTNRPGSFGLLGEPGLSFIKAIRCDIYFMSAQAIDQECASDTNLELIEQKRALMASAHKTILIAESARFSSRALYAIADLEKVDTIITDEGLSANTRKAIEAQGGVDLICVGVN